MPPFSLASLFQRITDPYAHERDQRRSRRAPQADLSRPAPRTTPRNATDTPLPRGTDTEGYRHLQRNPPSERSSVLRRAQQTHFLAERVASETNRERADSSQPPRGRMRVAGVDTDTGQARYAEEPASPEEIRAWAVTQSGAPREFIDALIGHESGNDPKARNPRSTATGHGQFIDNTWLGMVHRYGARYGQPELAEAIERNANGAYKVTNSAVRARIMALREDPAWAAVMVGHYGQENASALRARLGRNVREGEVYMAHFAGPAAAADLIRAAEREHSGRRVTGASIVGREAAEANRSVFYERNRARTAREVVQLQTRNFGAAMWPQARETRAEAGSGSSANAGR
jgi:hypothetical protein